MKLRLALAVATCLALPLAARAQPVTGPYVSLGAGTSLSNPFNYSYVDYTARGINGRFLSRPSYAGAIALGYGFGNGFRVELGGNFYRDTLHKNNSNSEGPLSITGGMNTYGPMINGYYDMDIGLPIYPYVGAGVGYQWVKFGSHINDINDFTYCGVNCGDTVEGTRGSFAYQIIGGVAYPLSMVPGLSVTAEYRFMQLTASRNYVTSYPGAGNVYDGPIKIGQESSHTFLIGLRYQLFTPQPPAPVPAPAPAPVAAPAPAPAHTYLVFFDWDKYNLSQRAMQIIAQAAVDSHSTAVTTLSVSGYTDTSGTPAYNMGLSMRRAKAVAGQLVADGVPASEIEIHAYGETNLLVPTGPGVREPQNRRVEIVLD